MKKSCITSALILIILFTATGIGYSGAGIKVDRFGPIIIEAHPWGETNYSTYVPPSFKLGSGSGLSGYVGAPALTNFTMQFYYNYVVKKTMPGQISTKKNGKSD